MSKWSGGQEITITVQGYWYDMMQKLAIQEQVSVERMAARLIMQSLYFRRCIGVSENVLKRQDKKEHAEKEDKNGKDSVDQ